MFLYLLTYVVIYFSRFKIVTQLKKINFKLNSQLEY